MIIVGGGIGCIGNVINLLYGQEDKNHVPMPVSLIGFLWGACLAASVMLRGKPPWNGLGDALGMVSAVSGIVYAVLIIMHRKRKRVAMPSQPPSAPSDKIWPPPPTSQGGQP